MGQMQEFEAPNFDDLKRSAEKLGMKLSDSQLQAVQDVIRPIVEGYKAIDAFPDEKPAVKFPRAGVSRPPASENPLGAWYYKTAIKGANGGPLSGYRVALKDNICLADVPMMNGAGFLDGTIPDVDATVVQRVLDAGGEIAGKAVCEFYSMSGGSHTSSTGPVYNPRKPGYTSGGSTSGCGALVAAGDVPMAVGCDQAGSIRIPASFCGIVGLKPTYGLVPYTGISSLEYTIDSTGPMTLTVADNALLLEVLAGPDRYDLRQRNPKVAKYTEFLDRKAKGLRIGLVKEGFCHNNIEPDVEAKVRAAAVRFAALGAEVREVSIPEHLSLGFPLWSAIRGDAVSINLLQTNSAGFGHEGLYVLSLIDATAAWRQHANELSGTVTVASILSTYTLGRYGGRYYAKAQNLRRRLRAAYDAALADNDLLLMPTSPVKAGPIPAPDASLQEVSKRSWGVTRNTCPFNVSGHPAISVPCGMEDGLPIGMMLVGKHWDEATLYRAAHDFERSGDWASF